MKYAAVWSRRGRGACCRATLLLGVLLLAACAGPGAPPPGGRGQSRGASTPATQLDKKPSESASLPAPASAPAPATGSLTPARLKGLTAIELKATLGTPTLLRRDGSAELWQYAGRGCVLMVFLYDERGTYRVTYSEVRVNDADITNPPICVEPQVKARARSASPVNG